MSDQIREKAVQAAAHFQFKGIFQECERYGNGHINDTFRIRLQDEKGCCFYILQRVNRAVFHDPDGLMDNISKVTGFLREKIIQKGGDPLRETLNLVPTCEGKNCYISEEGDYWRGYLFIEDAASFDAAKSLEDFYQSGKAFGDFQGMLADYPAAGLCEVIPDFHNTPARLGAFRQAVKEDAAGRAARCREEIRFLLEREEDMGLAQAMLERGELPLRVTHNDTKLNNIMIDSRTGKGICVIDLDTIMPGLSIFDFGDSIRFGANTALEDETDLTKVSLSLPLFESYTKGFLEGCGKDLTEKELHMLPVGAKLMTLECGMRFLTDYLQGDTYFKIHREHHNLDRCRTQLALVKDMEVKWKEMEQIVEKNR